MWLFFYFHVLQLYVTIALITKVVCFYKWTFTYYVWKTVSYKFMYKHMYKCIWIPSGRGNNKKRNRNEKSSHAITFPHVIKICILRHSNVGLINVWENMYWEIYRKQSMSLLFMTKEMTYMKYFHNSNYVRVYI